jgi:hypothetical protein
MNPVLLIVAIVAAGAIVGIIAAVVTLPFIKHNAMKSAYDLWDEPPAPESNTKAGD